MQLVRKPPVIHGLKLAASCLLAATWGFLIWFLVSGFPIREMSAGAHVMNFTNLLVVLGVSYFVGLVLIGLIAAMWMEGT